MSRRSTLIISRIRLLVHRWKRCCEWTAGIEIVVAIVRIACPEASYVESLLPPIGKRADSPLQYDARARHETVRYALSARALRLNDVRS
ncbi:MAG: hypothetical protein Aurels2KO_42580 [Aureliella sp.]